MKKTIICFALIFSIPEMAHLSIAQCNVLPSLNEVSISDASLGNSETILGDAGGGCSSDRKKYDGGGTLVKSTITMGGCGHFRVYNGNVTFNNFQIGNNPANNPKTIEIEAGATLTLNLANGNNWQNIQILNKGTLNIVYSGDLSLANDRVYLYNEGIMNIDVNELRYDAGAKIYNDGSITVGGTYDGVVYHKNTSGRLCMGTNAFFNIEGYLKVDNQKLIYSDATSGGSSCVRIGSKNASGREIEAKNVGQNPGDGVFNDPNDFLNYCTPDGVMNIDQNNNPRFSAGKPDQNSYASGDCSSGICGALPVQWDYFKVNLYNEESAHIQWGTLSEINNDYFIIEQSYDGIHWKEVEIVDGKGNSSFSENYEAILSVEGLSNIIYYRIAQIDWDGTKSYSSTKSLDLLISNQDNDCDALIYPSPVGKGEQLTINYSSSFQVDYEIYNLLGQMVGYSDENSFSVNLPEGSYVIKYNKGNGTCIQKINVVEN